jgi:hypothetical protein
MADFRRWFYALAVVALLAGLTVPASAQTPPFTCTTSVSVTPVVRAEGYTELTGDLVLNCNGGQPTTPGQPVPQVNFTVFLNTNATSKITAAPVSTGGLVISALFNEGLLIIDEPNSPLRTPRNPILNCGNAGAPDSGISSGPGVCGILATSDPAHTYDGTQNGYGGTGTGAGFVTTLCDGSTAPVRPVAETFSCGRPNVFQGRVGTPQNVGQLNAVTFLGVPVDPPGTTTNRTFRITNIRANATILGVSATFNQSQIQANIAINGPTTLTIANPQQIVAYVNRGMTVDIPSIGVVSGITPGGAALRNRLDFIQCVSENPDLFSATPAPNFWPVNRVPTFPTKMAKARSPQVPATNAKATTGMALPLLA